MGINRKTNKPCGFCFVEYTFKEDADLVRNLGPVQLMSRTLTFDQDIGFKHGRQYGRGKLGGQVGEEREDRSTHEYEPGKRFRDEDVPQKRRRFDD